MAELLNEFEPVLEADAPAERGAVGETETVLLLLTVELGVGVAVPVPVGLGEAVGVAVGVGDGVVELLSEFEPVLEADAPAERDPVGETDTVLLPLSVELGVSAAVPVLVTVGEFVGAGVCERDNCEREVVKKARRRRRRHANAILGAAGNRKH